MAKPKKIAKSSKIVSGKAKEVNYAILELSLYESDKIHDTYVQIASVHVRVLTAVLLYMQNVQYEGLSFPCKMDSPAAVRKLLTQQSSYQRVTKPTQLAQSGDGGVGDGAAMGRQAREAAFLQRVRKTAEEERANRLRWLGSCFNSRSVRMNTHTYIYAAKVQMVFYW